MYGCGNVTIKEDEVGKEVWEENCIQEDERVQKGVQEELGREAQKIKCIQVVGRIRKG